MTPVSQDGPGTEDPYASFFRPVEPELVEPELVEPEPIEPELVEPELVEPELVEVVAEQPQPAPAPTKAETGRVFKSLGVSGHEEALIAIPAHKAGRLRTLARDSQNRTDVIAVSTSSTANAPEIEVESPRVRRAPSTKPPLTRTPSARPAFIGSLSAPWVYAITIGVTFIFGLGDVLILGGVPGFLTGLGLLLATIFVSFAVKPSDDIHVIYAPAIAFFLVAITIGQINVVAGSLFDRFIEVFFILGGNWIWILGSTAFALTVVAIRRRSLR